MSIQDLMDSINDLEWCLNHTYNYPLVSFSTDKDLDSYRAELREEIAALEQQLEAALLLEDFDEG